MLLCVPTSFYLGHSICQYNGCTVKPAITTRSAVQLMMQEITVMLVSPPHNGLGCSPTELHMHTHTHTPRTCTHTHTHHTHTCTLTHTHTHHTYTAAHTHAHSHTHTHTPHIHSSTHTCTHSHTHLHNYVNLTQHYIDLYNII